MSRWVMVRPNKTVDKLNGSQVLGGIITAVSGVQTTMDIVDDAIYAGSSVTLQAANSTAATAWATMTATFRITTTAGGAVANFTSYNFAGTEKFNVIISSGLSSRTLVAD